MGADKVDDQKVAQRIASEIRFIADTISQHGDRFDYQAQRLYDIADEIQRRVGRSDG